MEQKLLPGWPGGPGGPEGPMSPWKQQQMRPLRDENISLLESRLELEGLVPTSDSSVKVYLEEHLA